MSEPPDGLQPGEQTLRFLVPTGWDLVPMFRRSSRLAGLLLGVGVVASVCACGVLGKASPTLGGVLAVGGLLVTFAGTAVTLFVRRPRRVRWWVTTRRLVMQVGDDVSGFDLDAVSGVDVDLSRDELQLTVGGEEKAFGPVNALGELWGAVLFGRVWGAPAMTLRDQPRFDDNTLRWGERREGLTIERGLVVLLPDAVGWIPETIVRSGGRIAGDLGAFAVGARVRRVASIPPIERFAFLVQRGDEPEFLPRETRRAALAWGGWYGPPAGWAVKPERGAVTLEFTRPDGLYRVLGVPETFARELTEGWTRSGYRGQGA